MYHSVTFGSMNSFSDWHLVPDGRQVIEMPEMKTTIVDIPGSSGILDLSESLTHYPIYKNRTGSLNFHVINDIEPWHITCSRIANYLHGKQQTLILEDDPDYYYQGRMTMSWKPSNDGKWPSVEIKYDLDPYKYYYQTSIEECPELYKNISVNNTTKVIDLSDEWSIGSVPVVPEFILTGVSGSGTTIRLVNYELGIDKTVTINSNGTRKYYDMVISNISGGNTCRITISGKGTVNIVFRRMSL